MIRMSTPSLVGCDSITVEFRAAWKDQIDDFGADCTHCQLEGHTVQVNLYFPDWKDARGNPMRTEGAMLHTCLPCVGLVTVDMQGTYDCDRPVIAEFAGKDRRLT
jgi:hypothetical protein